MFEIVDGKHMIADTSKGRLFVYLEEYSGKMMLHIRYWYRDKKKETETSGELWAPTAKGIAIPQNNINSLFEVLPFVLKPLQAEPEEEEPVSVYG